ncbi:hypothetical protein HYC85_026702 [Camellia sinensis]|uniref:DC1 domain-containing protein n=1 Tax=Camellia sinensis TaxID=4442 RepID=A0A7J7G4A3_CAMSI|nr:hypothetical protein HYC85_026702 [Camellia sinensis]
MVNLAHRWRWSKPFINSSHRTELREREREMKMERFSHHHPLIPCELPREIQHPFHPQQPLTLVKKLPDGSSSFDCCACSLRISGFAYQCIPCQTFFLDISCASLMPVTTNNDSDDAAQRLLFNHPHPLILCNNNRGFNQSYSACELLLNDSIYVCLIFKLLLHKSCAELPKKIKHPFHQIHALTLRTNDDGSPFSCKACLMPCGRFIYHCSKCDHSLDIRCASPVRTVSFREDNFPMPKVLCCVDYNFNSHLKCIPTLPETIKIGHRHHLTITDSMVKDCLDKDEKDATIVYYCDACEQ